MHALVLFFFLLIGVPPAVAAPVALHHDLRIRLTPAEQTLYATDRITVRPDGADRLLFALTPVADTIAATVDGQEVRPTFRHGRLAIPLPPDLRLAAVTVEIRYRARFADPVPTRPVNTEDPSYGVAGTIGEEGAFLGGGAGWYPEIDGSRPTVRLDVEMPAAMAAVSDGRLVEAAPGRSVWEARQPVRGLALAAGPYRRHDDDAGKVAVYAFFYPQSDALAKTYLAAARDYLLLYQELFGPYPFDKFAVVENFFPTGYGFPSWTLLGSSVIRLPFIAGTSLGHEVAHSWWGNGVWVDYARGNWSEGLTTYVADHLYKEQESIAEARAYRQKIVRNYASLVAAGDDFPLEAFTSRSSAAGQAVGYGKGAMVFHMARRWVGDDAFWEGLRRVAGEKLFQEAAWEDFAVALEQTGGTPMRDFFRQWVERPGAPVLSLGDLRRERTEGGWEVTGTLRQQAPFYHLRVPVRLETAAGAEEMMVEMKGAEEPFRFRTGAPPRRLVVDPEADVFRRLSPSEIPPAVNAVRGSTALVAVTAADLPPSFLEPARLLLAALGQQDAKIVAEDDLSPEIVRGHDLLFIGQPRRTDLRPSFPADLQVSGERVIVAGKAYGGEGTALFAALPHPAASGKVAGLFLAGSPSAAAAAARKIPHYGNYSYLVFDAGTNVAKGIWPVTDSPLIHLFDGERQ